MVDDLDYIELPDQRLKARLERLVGRLAEEPGASIPQACGTWYDTKAAYRFLDNERVSRAALIAGQRAACVERAQDVGGTYLLLVQDTTGFDFSHHAAAEGMGPLANAYCRGFWAHSTLMVSEQGVPCGLFDQQVWVRRAEEGGRRQERKRRAFVEKESYKWVAGLHREALAEIPQRVVMVADREGDVYEVFQEAQARGVDFVIRASWDRHLADPAGEHLFRAVQQTPVRASLTVDVARQRDRLARQAHLSLRFTQVTLAPPRHLAHKLAPQKVSVLLVKEDAPPAGEEPVQWLLLTSLPLHTGEQAQCYVRWYSYRWLIERFHYVLKHGCRLEERQLRQQARLERLLAVYSLVAWRLLWLTYQARQTPDAPCSLALTTAEWQALACYVNRTPTPPTTPPSLRQAVRWIAQLGGFLGRTGDGEPGVKVLWRGWKRLADITDTWLIFHPPDVGNV